EWIDDIGYYNTPGEIQSVAGVDVLVEDLSEGADVWISATLILDGLFIVVDGDHSADDVLMLIEALVEAAGGDEPSPADEPDDRPDEPQQVPTATTARGSLTTPDETYEPEMVEDWTVGLPAGVTGIATLALCCLLALVPVGGGVVVLRRRRNQEQEGAGEPPRSNAPRVGPTGSRVCRGVCRRGRARSRGSPPPAPSPRRPRPRPQSPRAACGTGRTRSWRGGAPRRAPCAP